MMRARLALAAAALALGAGCIDQTTRVSDQVVNAAGRYGLTTVNDTVLPRTIQTRTNYTLEITSDTIVLNADGTWADGTLYRETTGDIVATFSNFIGGSFDVVGGVVSFHSNSGGFEGTLSGNTLTINGAAKAVYRK